MQPPPVARFGFRIRTRQGIIVDNVTIPGRDAADAERKVRQVYRDCVIITRLGISRMGEANTVEVGDTPDTHT